MKYTFANCKDDIAKRWAAMRITRAAESDAAARKILKGRKQYEAVESATGVPWQWIGLSHLREANCDFRGVLHNGEKIIGTGKKTTLIPAGRGPFKDWHSAAIDAIKIKGLEKIKDWSIEQQLYQLERFNGFGYRGKGVPSAYIWSGTDQYVRGKYIRDKVWSATAVDKQLGCAPVLKRLMQMTGPRKTVRETVKESPSLRMMFNALLAGITAAVLSVIQWVGEWAGWLVSLLPLAAEDVSSAVGSLRSMGEYVDVDIPIKILLGVAVTCIILVFRRQLEAKRSEA